MAVATVAGGRRTRDRPPRFRRLDGIAQMYLALESTSTPMHFGALVVLDGGGKLGDEGALPLTALRARLRARVAGIPELRQVVRPAGPLAGAPVWVEDPDFRIEHHVVEARLPPSSTDEAALMGFVEALMAPVLDRAHPLWRLWCVTGLPDGRVGLLFACHHAMTDGLGAVRLARALLDEDEVAAISATPEPPPRWPELVVDHARGLADQVRAAMDPAARRAVRVVLRTFIAGWAATRDEPPTSLNDPVGPGRRLALVRFDQREVRGVARARGAAINDVVLALVAGGVRELVAARGEPTERLVVRAGIAVTLPPSKRRGDGANQFGGYAIELPIREPDPVARIRDNAAAYAHAQHTQRVTGTTAVRVLASRFRITRAMLARQRYIQVMETFLPGPPRAITLLGAPLLDFLPIQPLGRNVGLTVVASTYAGRLTIGVRADLDRFPDLDRFTAAIERDWAALTASAAPADVAPDGSPVAFYRRLPAEGEPELIHEILPAGATVLDIGCGTGRIAGPQAALGHAVTGVDDGPGMIAALPDGVEGVVGDGRSIRLGRRFDAVLLASHLVNLPGDGGAFAATAAAHVRPDGVVIGQTYPPGFDPTAGVGQVRTIGTAHVELVRAERVGDRLESTVRYGVDGQEWTQSFTTVLLDEDALRTLLADASLTFDRWLDRPGWFLARPS